MNEIKIFEAEDYFSRRTIYRAEVPILEGHRKAAGIADTPEGAVEELALWLARSAVDFVDDEGKSLATGSTLFTGAIYSTGGNV